MRVFLLGLLIALTGCGASDVELPAKPEASVPTPQPVSEAPAALPVFGYEVVAEYPHTDTPFTQGLFFHEGVLYESSGQFGESALIRHDLWDKAERAVSPLPDSVFGEGSVAIGQRIYSLTWQSGIGHIHDLTTLEQLDTFKVDGEGWGLTYDGTNLILSDGSADLRFMDPTTFEIIRTVTIMANGRPISKLNELEWINGEVWANIWQADLIARIDPTAGKVTGFVNLSGLYRDPVAPHNHVLNGIAYDPETERLLVTGKRWPKIYELTITGP